MIVTRHQFDKVIEAIWGEIEYQNNLPRRSDTGEAKDVPGFLTLGRRYLRKAEDAWADTQGQPFWTDGAGQPFTQGSLTAANHHIRKLAAIFIRAMVYTGIFRRQDAGDTSI